MIASSPIWYLHDEVAFPEPHIYRPGRWLSNDMNEATKLRNEYYIPFSKGPGTCVGVQSVVLCPFIFDIALSLLQTSVANKGANSSFAYLELFLSVSHILKEYLIESCSDTIVPSNVEAVLPLRREWVAAVPTGPLHVSLRPRSGLHNENATGNNHVTFQET